MKKNKTKFKKMIERIVLLISICVFLFAAYNLFIIYKANYDEKKETESIRDLADLPTDEDKLDEFTVDFSSLQAINPDIIGWIVVKDTEISYPIVQGSDNDYYLNHTFEKKENYAGAIFMDYTASSDFSDNNTFIYGHNVYHGTMFAELSNYMDQDFFKAHPYIYLYTPNGNYKLQVFSAYIDDAASDSYQMAFSSQEEFGNYLNRIISKSVYSSGVSVDSSEKIISLYTCSYENGQNPDNSDAEYINERYYIHAKIIKEL